MCQFARYFAIGSCALAAVLVGCNSNPAVTIGVSSVERKGEEVVEVGSSAVMTSNIPGAIVTVGGTADEGISARIAEIVADKVVIEVTHPPFAAQRATLKLGESTEVFFSDGSQGVRLRFTEPK